MNMRQNRLDDLRQQIQKLERSDKAENDALPFGSPLLDAHLPKGGLELGVLHEVSAAPGICHETAATLFVAGILARTQGPVLWCLKTRDLFAPGLALVGLEASRIIFAETGDEKTLLTVMEEGLRHGGLSAVVGEMNSLRMIAARRLHLAARSSGTTAFALYRQPAFRKDQVNEPTAAVTRWRITALPSQVLPVAGIGRPFWQIDLLRCRDAGNASWITEACDEKGSLGLATNMAHRQNSPIDIRACA
jgi:protein ImuA